MAHPVKIALVGAGSAQFSLALLRDLVLSDELNGSTVSLMDIDAGRLNSVRQLTERYVREVGADLVVESSDDLKVALTGADFVINTALAGGHPAYEAERSLADAHGYYRGVSPLHMQRNLLLMLDVAHAIQQTCPDAWLIQASNPVFEGCTLMTRETDLKIVGLCHGYRGYLKVADLLGLDPDLVTWQAPGFNHVIYLTEFFYQGQSAYPLLDEWIATTAESHWARTDLRFSASDLSRSAIDQYKRVGLLPLGDASRGFETWWYHTDLETKKYWFGHLGGFDSELGWQQYLDHLSEGVENIRRAVADEETPITKTIPLVHSGENHVPLIESLVTGTERVIQVNLPNNGAIAGLPDDVVVEGKGLVQNGRVQLLNVGPLPGPLMHKIILPRWVLLEQTMWALRRHDYGMLREMVMEDHRTKSPEQADGLLDAAFAADYNQAVANWYKPTGAGQGRI
jgi:alpha-galactosidase